MLTFRLAVEDPPVLAVTVTDSVKADDDASVTSALVYGRLTPFFLH